MITRRSQRPSALGIGQLTLVEHALCPLDARSSVVANLVHEATFRFSDKARIRQTGHVRVLCPLGLSPKDEFFLWGLLAITIADPQTDGELHATRHYCLRRLGLIDAKARRGGRQYSDFTAAIERLAAVRYHCDNFYDPIRTEHRRVAFGFFSYNIPLDDESNRAWRFIWDPLFFEFVRAAGGSLRFDLHVYRQLDVASRRLYLFLRKLLYRKAITPRLDLSNLAEQILGVAQSVSIRDKKIKLKRSVAALARHGIIQKAEILRLGKGRFALVAHRGPKLKRPVPEPAFESPHVEPLTNLGFDLRGASRILRKFDHPLVREWIDITLAAQERFGSGFFKRGAPAFLTDNLNKAAIGQRTPPDWWAELRRSEEGTCAERARRRSDSERDPAALPERASEGIDDVLNSVFLAAGQPEERAKVNAKRFRKAQLRRNSSTS